MDIITSLEVQKRNKERVSVYLNNEYAFSLSLVEAAKLRKGQSLSDDDIVILRDEDAVVSAINHAARFLSYRPRSEHEIRRNLAKKKKWSDTVIDAAIFRMHSMAYIDDETFAKFWIEDRETFNPRGPMALRYELRQKGVSENVIDATLASFDSFTSALQAARKKTNQYRGMTERGFRQKLSGFLQRRGFRYETIREVYDELIPELIRDDSEYFVGDEDFD